VSTYISTTSEYDVAEIDRLPSKRLGQLLYQQRIKSGVGAAALLGISDRALEDIEAGRRRPDLATVVTLMGLYECSFDELVPPRWPLVLVDMSGWSHTQVLTHYLAAVQGWRATGTRQERFRQEDLVVLVDILGTDPDEIVRRLIALTGCSRKVAKKFRRIVGGGLASIAALGVVGLAVAGASGSGPTSRSSNAILSTSAHVAPAGASTTPDTDFAFWGEAPDGHPYRWNPLETVTVAYVAVPGAPAIDVPGAVARLAQATGLSMDVVGTGTADITITFVPKLSGHLAGSTSEDRDTDGFIHKASVVLSEQTPRALLHEALLHELGHAVGLGHASAPGQVMDPVLAGETDYQSGDLAGLRAVGPNGEVSAHRA
jgi:transcriptional regulator with XRE-family HTH domain